MNTVFYFSGAVAVVATALAITRSHPIHALLNLVVSLLAVAVVFFTLGAPFIAALEAMIYAGAIMVVFVFAVMMMDLGDQAAAQEKRWIQPGAWLAPALLTAILAAETIYIFYAGASGRASPPGASPKQVGLALFGPYLLGVELASFLLLAGLVGAYHLGRRNRPGETAVLMLRDRGAGKMPAPLKTRTAGGEKGGA